MRSFDRRKFLAGTAASAAVAALPLRARAQAASEGGPEWAKTVAAAEQEGKLVVMAAPNPQQREFLLKQWGQEFPKIELSVSLISGGGFVPTVMTERSAGKYLWDVLVTGPNTAHRAAEAGLFDALLPELLLPDANKPEAYGGWNEAFYDEGRKFVLSLVSEVQTPYYNARLLAPERAKAEELKLLLDPQLKGKIVFFEPRAEGPGAPFMALIYRRLGPDALWKIMVDQDPFFVRSQNEVAEALVRGKATVGFLGNARGVFKQFSDAGVNFDVRPLGNTPGSAYIGSGGSTLAIFNRRPHPNASRVFVNWIMTQRVAQGLARAQGFESRRIDVPPMDPAMSPIPGESYVYAQRSENDALLRELITELKKRRPQ